MDHMRKHKLSPGVTNSRLAVSTGRKRPDLSAATSARYGNPLENEAINPDFSAYSRCLSATINSMMLAKGNAAALSVEALLQEVLVSQLIGICQSIRGAKILTVCRDHDAAFTARVNKDDQIAEGRVYTKMLRSELSQAVSHGGTFIIRQILPMKTRQAAPGGETAWLTWKNVYAFYLGNGTFEAIPVDHLNYANSVGPDGKPVARENGVRFCEYRTPAHIQAC